MGQKVNPIGLRLGINRTWDSRWYAEGAEYSTMLHEDIHIRKVLRERLAQAGVAKIDYLVITHFHTDHVGGVMQLAGKMPISNIVDHGNNIESGDGPETLKSLPPMSSCWVPYSFRNPKPVSYLKYVVYSFGSTLRFKMPFSSYPKRLLHPSGPMISDSMWLALES